MFVEGEFILFRSVMSVEQ